MNIEWQDSYCIDNDRIDVQHQKLFAHANAVFALKGQAGQQLAIIQLYAHLRSHFANEEALMREVNFPEYKSHVHLHNDMLASMNSISVAIGKNQATDEDIHKFMSGWLLGHIAQEDTKIAAYVRKHAG